MREFSNVLEHLSPLSLPKHYAREIFWNDLVLLAGQLQIEQSHVSFLFFFIALLVNFPFLLILFGVDI